jgi:hypothetical protein
VQAQQLYTKSLMKADRLFIEKEYAEAAIHYEKYLQKFERDYYASRQAAICFDYINDHYSAAEHWPAAVESSESTEDDLLMYAKSLIENDRLKEALKILPILAKSPNPYVSNWGKTWANRQKFYTDSVQYRVHFAKELNTDADENCPMPYQGKLVYERDRSKNPKVFFPAGHLSSRELRSVNFLDTLLFTESDVLSRLKQIHVYGPVSFSADGQEMYFCKAQSNKEAGVKSPFTFYKYQLFVLNMASLNDAAPQIRPFNQNSMLYNYMHPSVSADGEHLYFASDMKGSTGGTDLYICHKINGEWSAPINLGPLINTAGNEVYPHALPEGNLVFASDGWPGMGGLDLYLSEANEGILQAAKNLGFPINTRYDDFACIFTQKNKGYFSSNRKEGTDDDLYFFAKYSDLQSE